MNSNYQLIELDTVDSTNRYLKDYCSLHQPDGAVFCTTQQQTNGYGQQQRSWLTNSHSAIFSLAFPIDRASNINGLLSLQVATLVHEALAQFDHQDLYLKWPNDLYNDQGKLAGILIEQVLLKDYRALIIGVGINRVQMEALEGCGSASNFELNDFLVRLYALIEEYALIGFDEKRLFSYWQRHDYFSIGECVSATLQHSMHSSDQLDNGISKGIYKGINQHGQAILNLDDANSSSGDVLLTSGTNSIRKLMPVK